MKFFLVLFPFAYLACQPAVISLAEIKSVFSRPEYSASNDGWAEARRRTLLKKYLQARGIPFRESTAVLRGKYNRVTLHAGNTGGKARRVTLSLSPAPGVAAAQALCDKVLFRVLEREITAVDFVMTDSCIIDQ